MKVRGKGGEGRGGRAGRNFNYLSHTRVRKKGGGKGEKDDQRGIKLGSI